MVKSSLSIDIKFEIIFSLQISSITFPVLQPTVLVFQILYESRKYKYAIKITLMMSSELLCGGSNLNLSFTFYIYIPATRVMQNSFYKLSTLVSDNEKCKQTKANKNVL